MRIALLISGRSQNVDIGMLKKFVVTPITKNNKLNVFTYTTSDIDLSQLMSVEVVSRYTDHSHPIPHSVNTNSRIMFYRWKVLFENSFEDYDYIILTRPDIHFRDYISTITNFSVMTVFPRISLPLRPHPTQMTDVFIAGPVSMMMLLGGIYDRYIKTSCIHPELYLYNYITHLKIPYVFNQRMTPSAKSINSYSITKKEFKTIVIVSSSKGCEVS